jgi:hypothetical protein
MPRRSPPAPPQPPIPIWTNQPIVLYHGTVTLFVWSLMSAVNVNAGNPFRDFGRGFYTTTNLEQARAWARARARRMQLTPAVVQFTLERHVLARLDTLWFVAGSEHAIDYWSFVRHCRRGEDHSRGGANPWYDVVVGPVARRWLDELRAYRHYDQVSFHTRLAAETLDQSNPRIVR